MKKIFSATAVILGCMLILVACNNQVNTNDSDMSVESTCPYALMYGGVTYYYTGEEIFQEVIYDSKDILGKVTSVIPETKMPSADCQANIAILDSIFIKHELSGDGLLVLIDGKWTIFENRGN